MRTAIAFYKNSKKRIIVDVSQLKNGEISTDDLKDCRCTSCGASASFVRPKEREYHFKAHHEPNCEIVQDGREHRLHRINDETQIEDILDIISRRDSNPKTETNNNTNTNPTAQQNSVNNDIDVYDCITQYGVRNIRSVGPLYKYVINNGKSAPLFDEVTGNDIILFAKNIDTIRNAEYETEIGARVAITRRVAPSMLNNRLEIPDGYLCFADNFTQNLENAVLFLVKLRNNAQNDLFRQKVFVTELKKRNILLLGNWRPHHSLAYQHVYITEINTHCYSFLNV